MRLDLPVCNFKSCHYESDGNCTRIREKWEECEVTLYDRYRWHYVKDKDFPKEKGLYLVWRDFNGSNYPEMLAFDGRFWVTMSDSPSNRIIAWKEIEPPEGVWI